MGAKLYGAGQIIAVDMVDDRLEMARQVGAKYTINASLENPQQKVMEKVALVACMRKLLTILNAT
jgi:threonine dehydrogenase-like Zn-dependent dehydrogenase